MQDFEKLGALYLGRPYDLGAGKPRAGLILYDSRDLVTHAVCVGMTGSGKTGLCLALLEEAAIDGVPAIAVDPKGDIANLLLQFPELRPADFGAWVNPDEARAQGLAPDAFAARQAELWREGLAEWGQDGARIRRLGDAADFAVYTPGSTAGLPVSILKSFAAPAPELLDDSEAMRDRVAGTAASLLGLAGIEADPIRSREHILISNILDAAWRAGRDLDLAALIQEIQQPAARKIGVLDLETFFPARDRFALALALNNLLASPGFQTWLEGEALDVGALLHTASGAPRVSIFSIAHLAENERMFFVALLLNQVLAWVRSQPGTTSLRALLYMDEIFGYFPPVANPPSKPPLLRLLKQARASGLGIVLATQNPVDLDYKGLANTGTWFIGRLQTERDKARLLEGLEGAAAGASGFDRRRMEETLAGLGQRVFLMNNVHEDAPVVFQTRWTLSYLRGPLTRDEIKRLMAGRKGAAAAPEPAPPPASQTSPAPAATSTGRPVLPPKVSQYFLPIRGSQPAGSKLAYRPMALGIASVRFVDTKSRIDSARDLNLIAPITSSALPVQWDQAVEIALAPDDLLPAPERAADYGELPAAAADPKSYPAWAKDLAGWLSANQKLEIYKSPSLGETSGAGESERDFRARLRVAAREERDRATEALRGKYAPRLAALGERLRRAQAAEARETEQVDQQKIQTAISVGATLLDAFMGRKVLKSSTLGRAATAARGASRTLKEAGDVARARDTVEAVRRQIADLESQLREETAVLQSRIDPASETLETITGLVGLAWVPSWIDADGKPAPAWE
ncbi:MAG: ATP-binding protein [Acidobacteria bacterium]|nr:MAG: ATP-binding protein [Acidobacteriota bacterium]